MAFIPKLARTLARISVVSSAGSTNAAGAASPAMAAAVALAAFVALACAQGQAQAQAAPPAQHAGHEAAAAKPGHGPAHGASPSSSANMAAMEKMNKAMNAPMTGDADRDFVSMMIPHHQGAIEMARIQLQYGRDPTLRKMAADIIKAQEAEIAVMKKWKPRR